MVKEELTRGQQLKLQSAKLFSKDPFLREDDEPTGIGPNFFGLITIFSFVSIILIFTSMMVFGAINNYALVDLLSITNTYVTSGMVPANYNDVAEGVAQNYILIIPYLDYIWLASFIAMVTSSLTYSYMARRENYFSIMSFSVFGLVLFVYVGGIFIQLTDWFKTEFLYSVFPAIQTLLPIFSWYIENLAIINLILLTVNIIVNFVDFDMLKFDQRKKEVTDEL